MKKIIKNTQEIRDKMRGAVRLITEPVIQTLSPRGLNVIYEDSTGQLNLTNDGVTIAKQITSSDAIADAIISIIKHGALKTNEVAGDGTTTTTLFTDVILNEGWKQIDEGVNPMVLKNKLEEMSRLLVEGLQPIKIKDDEDLLHIATISANNDTDIAQNVVDIVHTAGQHGLVIIENSNKEETIVEKNIGFVIEEGIYSPEYAQNGGFTTTLEDCPVLVTDKRIYYEEEVETIIRTAIEGGIENLVIVAKDYIGKAVNAFSNNQINNPRINLLLIKTGVDAGDTVLSDLATYLDGPLVTEKAGKLVDNLKIEDFCRAKRVYANPHRTVIAPMTEPSTKLLEIIDYLKKEKEEDDTKEEINKRLATLTSGMVSVKVGGSTPIEVREKVFRYEDAINATRSALKYGYLVGGGMGILGSFVPDNYSDDIRGIAQKLCEASIRQIAKNCGEHEGYILSQCKPTEGIGYNAKTGGFEDLIGAGIIDPYKVTEMAIKNSVSIANSILTAGYIIVNKKEDDKSK